MALYDLHRSNSVPVSAVIAHKVGSFIVDLLEWRPAPRVKRRVLSRSLRNLSDRQLADLGLLRSDLDRV